MIVQLTAQRNCSFDTRAHRSVGGAVSTRRWFGSADSSGPLEHDGAVHFPSEVVSGLDLHGALAKAAVQRGGFLPSALAASSALQDKKNYVKRLRVKLVEGVDLRPVDVVFAHRYGAGTRPIPDLSLEARVVVEALATVLVQRLADDADLLGLTEHVSPAPGHKKSFEHWPLEAPRPKFVGVGDVASFYEYVDHKLLAKEIVELTGDSALASTIRSALSEIMGRQFGLPQGPPGADVFAALYLSPVDRALQRAGLEARRFNDDYLLLASSPPQTRRDLATIERLLRDLGLILNHQKTAVLTVAEYELGLKNYEEILEAAAIESVDLPPGYKFDPDEFEGTSLETADEEVIAAAFDRAMTDATHPLSARQKMIDTSLPYLAGFENTGPLTRLQQVVDLWPAHIRNYNLYLRAFIGTTREREVVSAIIESLQGEVPASPWVQGWLIDVLARCRHVDGEFSGWLADVATGDDPWFVRGRAAIALARTGDFLDQDPIAAIFGAAPQGMRLDLTAAVCIANPSWTKRFTKTFSPGDVLERQLVALVSSANFKSAAL